MYGLLASDSPPDVGSKPPTRGFFDLAGSLYEFTRDGFAGAGNGYPKNPCDNCVLLGSAPIADHVIRGGGYVNGASVLSPKDGSNRLPFYFGGNNVGFRCARIPSP